MHKYDFFLIVPILCVALRDNTRVQNLCKTETEKDIKKHALLSLDSKPFKWVIDKHKSKQSSISNIFHIKSALEADENVKAFGRPNLKVAKVIFIFMSPHLHRYI